VITILTWDLRQTDRVLEVHFHNDELGTVTIGNIISQKLQLLIPRKTNTYT
jgi:hypothetical protein